MRRKCQYDEVSLFAAGKRVALPLRIHLGVWAARVSERKFMSEIKKTSRSRVSTFAIER